jgi:hypothetical protein
MLVLLNQFKAQAGPDLLTGSQGRFATGVPGADDQIGSQKFSSLCSIALSPVPGVINTCHQFCHLPIYCFAPSPLPLTYLLLHFLTMHDIIKSARL